MVLNLQSLFNSPGLDWMNKGSTNGLLVDSSPQGFTGNQIVSSIANTPNPPVNLNKAVNSGGLTFNNNVLGASTASPAGGGNGGDSRIQELAKMSRNPSQESEYQNLLNQYGNSQASSINSGWDSYINSLNDQLGVTNPNQRKAQEDIVNSSYQQGLTTADTQRRSSVSDVESQQAKNLKDLSSNIQNLFTAGNINLGARGASDSSAADQYSYAISKMGSKNRAEIMTDASNRLNKIKDIYDTEINRLSTERDTQFGNIATWFNQAQAEVKQLIGQAGLNKQQDIQNLTKDLYNQALTAMQTVQNSLTQKKSQLESWASNNSKSTNELIANMKSVQALPEFSGLSGGLPQVTSEGQAIAPVGFGTQQAQKRDLFGNIIG